MLFDVMEALFLDGNPSGVKAALDILGLIQNNLRLPLVKVNKSVNAQIKRVVEEIA
jgi:4-hydroxy-tetrahydrodipicolinate synthase